MCAKVSNRTHHCLMYESLNWLAPKSRRQLHGSILIVSIYIYLFQFPFKLLLIPFRSQYSLRHMDHLFLFTPKISKEIGGCAFKLKAPSDWNVPPHLGPALAFISLYHL